MDEVNLTDPASTRSGMLEDREPERAREPATPAGGQPGAGAVGSTVIERYLGRGRSATVYAVAGSSGTVAAKKIFVGSTLAGIVHRFFFGADNPYIWSREAIAEAHIRRQALSILVRWWLPEKLRVAESHAIQWNDELKVNELTMEFVDGRGALLRNPLSEPDEDELDDLVGNVMKPLQAHLIEAGFDGAAWQAGYFNPVASSNFMLESLPDGSSKWVWIDMESGVPALFSANPIGLLSFYLPRSVKHGHPLFDDVDVEKLKRYLETHREALQRDLGQSAWTSLQAIVSGLTRSDNDWRNLGWITRGIEARLRRGQITEMEAQYFRERRLRWLGKECGQAARASVRWARVRIVRYLNLGVVRRALTELAKLIISEGRRAQFARNTIGGRIDKWHARRQLSATERNCLMDELHTSESSVYLGDFGMHLAIKPLVKFVVWLVVPLLYSAGAANEFVLAAAVVGGGSIGRTVYTTIRIAGATAKGTSKPWMALLVGTLPMIGNAAFPIQVIYDGAGRGERVAKFIIYYLFTRLGEIFPIWGGADTLLEHRFNRLAHCIFRACSRAMGGMRRPRPGGELA